MKQNLLDAIGLLQNAQTAFDTNINQLSGQVDDSVFNPLFDFMKQDSDGTLAELISKATVLVGAIPEGI